MQMTHHGGKASLSLLLPPRSLLLCHGQEGVEVPPSPLVQRGSLAQRLRHYGCQTDGQSQGLHDTGVMIFCVLIKVDHLPPELISQLSPSVEQEKHLGW